MPPRQGHHAHPRGFAQDPVEPLRPEIAGRLTEANRCALVAHMLNEAEFNEIQVARLLCLREETLAGTFAIVWLVEGVGDAFKAIETGFPAVAVLGNELST